MKIFKLASAIAILILGVAQVNTSSAQCGAGEVEITFEFSTDNWGYEAYWELVPEGNNCGAGTIASGGNTAQLGCNSGGLPATATTGNGYASNQTITVDNICVLEGTALDLIIIDDYGDGGLEINVLVDGFQVGTFEGSGGSNTFSFSADLPADFDLSAYAIHEPYTYMQPGPVNISGLLFNTGLTTITSLTLNYQINSDPVQSVAVTGLNLANYETEEVEHATAWNPSYGIYTVKLWASDLNGNPDLVPGNDIVERTVEVGDPIPNYIDLYVGGVPDIQEFGSSSDGLDKPTDLDFHPVLTRKELWVINKKTEANGGSTTTYYDAGESGQTDETREDGNNWHFMSLPTGIAFGENENFANSPGVYDANHDGGSPFTGPALWSSDPAIYAQPSGGNGSHLDMLHESPYSQGIAHERGNAYWVFDGNRNDIVMYDFKEDHGPGNTYHSDAVIHRYSEQTVAKDPADKISSHLVLDKATNWLYVVDHGNQRVIRIDITSGTVGPNATPVAGEPVAELKQVIGYTQEDVVTTGLLKPCGIDIVEDRMIVSDYETSDIIIYDISSMPAVEMGRINTGALGIMGVKIGPEGRIWYVDYDGNKLYRVDSQGVGVDEVSNISSGVYPNPNNGSDLTISVSTWDNAQYEIFDIAGKTVQTGSLSNSINRVSTNLNSGMYVVRVRTEGVRQDHRLIVY